MNSCCGRANHNPWATRACPVKTSWESLSEALCSLTSKSPLVYYRSTNPHTLFVLKEAGAVHLQVKLPTGAQLVAEVLLHKLLLRGEKVLHLEEESGSNRTHKREKSACREDFCQP